jgi:hypothetical protein
MTLTILGIVATLISFGVWLYKREAGKHDDPKNKIQKEKNENRNAIADGNAGRLLNERLDRLPPSQGAGPKP